MTSMIALYYTQGYMESGRWRLCAMGPMTEKISLRYTLVVSVLISEAPKELSLRPSKVLPL